MSGKPDLTTEFDAVRELLRLQQAKEEIPDALWVTAGLKKGTT